MGVSCLDGDCDACGFNPEVEEKRIETLRALYAKTRDASEDRRGRAVSFTRSEIYKAQLEREGKK